MLIESFENDSATDESSKGLAFRRLLFASIVPALFSCASVESTRSVPTQYGVPIIEGLEQPPPDELRTIHEVVELAREDLLKQYCDANPGDPCCAEDASATCSEEDRGAASIAIARRDAHAKHHGCVLGSWETTRAVPAELAHGVFAPGVRHDAVIRFSNGNPKPQPDRKGDGRGMAIKLMGVPGEKLIADERETQDFLLISHPVFFIRDAEEYLDFQRASASTFRQLLFFAFNGRSRRIATDILAEQASNPLEIGYHSMTPYLLGPRAERRAVKYATVPIGCEGQPLPISMWDRDSDDFLREAMVKQLGPGPAGKPACFDFYVVPRPSEQSPVEDATESWGMEGWIKVARITVPLQSFDSPDQQSFCENLAFTPWHSLPVHQPIGGLNRLRLDTYREISTLRRQLNRVGAREPAGSSWSALLEPEEPSDSTPMPDSLEEMR
jgi:hypothetical protein